MTELDVYRALFSFLFVLVLFVACWSVVVMTRMRRDQSVALSLLVLMAERAGFKEVIDKIQSSGPLNGLSKKGIDDGHA